jgi:glycerophosphoryl diester phosphodiesterase
VSDPREHPPIRLSRRDAVRRVVACVLIAGATDARRAGAADAPSARGPRIAAHRGGAGLWPENSLLAFRNAVRLGVDLLEFDVHLTADGEPVVLHDPTLERTTTGSGAIGGLTMADLASVRLKARDGTVTDERIPTVDAVLDVAVPSSVRVMPEIKVRHDRRRYDGIEDRVIAALRSRRMLDRAIVQSFDADTLASLRERVPGLATMMLVTAGRVRAERATAADVVRWATAVGATDLGIDHRAVDAALVASARKASLRVSAWTVNEKADLERMMGLGVDAVITDRPDLALRLLGRP